MKVTISSFYTAVHSRMKYWEKQDDLQTEAALALWCSAKVQKKNAWLLMPDPGDYIFYKMAQEDEMGGKHLIPTILGMRL